MKKFSSNHIIILTLLIISQLIVSIIFASAKQGFFIDEIFSYSLSNAYFKYQNFPSNELYNQWTKSDYLTNLVTVSDDHRFAYDSVIYNQQNDVHPPLYYFILHSICSFFPGTFSKWYGLAINIILFLISGIYLLLLSKCIFEEFCLVLLPYVFWVFSPGAISDLIFIRMYMLLTVLGLMLVYYTYRFMQKEIEIKNEILLFISISLGLLTHYYFIIFFVIFITLSLSYFLINHYMKKFFHILFISICSLLTSYLIFPTSINHIFSSSRGKEVINNSRNIMDLPKRLLSFTTQISKQQFGGVLKEYILLLTTIFIISIILRVMIKKGFSFSEKIRKMKEKKSTLLTNFLLNLLNDKILFFILLISTIFSFLTIAFISPYITTRYVFFLYPFFSLLITIFSYSTLSRIITRKFINIILIVLCISTFIFLSYKHEQVNYLYEEYDQTLTIAKMYSDYDCIYITYRPWKVEANIFDLSEYNQVMLLKENSVMDFFDSTNSNHQNKGFIIYIDHEINQTDTLNSILSSGNYIFSKYLYSTSDANAYIIE